MQFNSSAAAEIVKEEAELAGDYPRVVETGPLVLSLQRETADEMPSDAWSTRQELRDRLPALLRLLGAILRLTLRVLTAIGVGGAGKMQLHVGCCSCSR